MRLRIADILDDCRALVRSNCVRMILTLALSLALQSFMPSTDVGQLVEAILSCVDWALIGGAIFFRARARGPIPIGRAMRERQAQTQ